MKQLGFSYIELSIASMVFSITAISLLSLLANMTTAIQELNIVSQVRAQANAQLVETLSGAGITPTSKTIKNEKGVTLSPLSKNVQLKSATLTELSFASSQRGKDFNITHTMAITVLPSPPASIYLVHQLNLAYKPVM